MTNILVIRHLLQTKSWKKDLYDLETGNGKLTSRLSYRKAVFDSRKKRRAQKRSFFPEIWLAVENLLRNRLEHWAPFLLRFESSNIFNLQLQRFIRTNFRTFAQKKNQYPRKI